MKVQLKEMLITRRSSFFKLFPLLICCSLLAVGLLTTGCTNEKKMKEEIKKVITEDPSILIGAIKAKPLEFMQALQEAAQMAQMEMVKKQEEEQKKELEKSFDKPLSPKIGPNDNIRGKKDAPIVLFEYSDFQCPFCARAAKTVEEVRKKYGDKIQFIYKHLPLEMHPQSMIAAQYYEAIRIQDPEKAWKFHDDLYNNPRELQKGGEAYLKSEAKKLGMDMDKLAKDVNSAEVKNKIEDDKKEAEKFGFQGTPQFILNGVPIHGAYPASYFDNIIEELKKRGKIKL